ncbi:reverse transcriptase domain-containing protein [Tanacetum coccineum]
MWVKWVNIYWLKGRSMWDVELNIGCNVWFDKWSPQGPLSRLISHTVLEQANLCVKTRVVDIIDNNEWKWPIEWVNRHAFISWVAIKGRLKTLDMNSKWMNIQGMVCHLCNQDTESHSHLFFKLNVIEAAKIWNLQLGGNLLVNKGDYYKRMDEDLGKGSDPMECQ